MAHVAGEIEIDRPVEEVFDFVADQSNEPRYNPRLISAEKVSEEPIGEGTKFRAEVKTMGWKSPMTIEFTEFERPRSLVSSTRTSGAQVEGALTFEPVSGGTRMRWQWQLKPRGPMKLIRPLIARVGERQEQKIWNNLKRLLEAEKDDEAEG